MLRAIGRYLRQAGTTFSDRYVEQALVNHPEVARLLVDLVLARFDPEAADSEAADRLVERIEEQIDAVESLDQDRILRSFLGVVRATLRTNFFQRDADGERKRYLSFKLDPEELPWLPLPRPRFEIFVYSPRTEGVHLRGGKVARGGIRWSDRREDFRTEVLGLMKAQMVKNAVIVPVGAKGGFVVKRPPPGDDRDELLAEVEACYRTFIAGCSTSPTTSRTARSCRRPTWCATTRTTPTWWSPPTRAPRRSPTWPTAWPPTTASGSATRSPRAGSTGYDHKQMGITAKGAWESVKRHFRELGRDVQEEDFTVVGIGDMSGDVFGNGMLLSKHIRLVGAFDHRHVFLDPDPDPAASWEERRRLFELERSSWADYDRELISEGGGVFSRAAKSIELSPQLRSALDVRDEALAPNDLIRALLRAPVDLLWNGGIGTYVKATAESHAEAGDKANDGVRVDGAELRCRVVGEGGNLGLTQRGRIEYARKGGRVNTDAIDNSGGVDCSDREVNIKVLLDQVVAERRPDPQAARPAAGGDDAGGERAGAQGQLRAERDAVAGRDPGGRDGRRVHALPRVARGVAQAGPRAGGAAGRRGTGRAQPRGQRADAAGAGRGAGLQQDRPVRGAARLRRPGGPAPVRRARPLLPGAAAASGSQRSSATTGCAGRSSRRR